MDTGEAGVKLCSEHSLAHEILQRQSEIDRGPRMRAPSTEKRFSGTTLDAPNTFNDSAEEQPVGMLRQSCDQFSKSSLLGSGTTTVTDTQTKKKKKKAASEPSKGTFPSPYVQPPSYSDNLLVAGISTVEGEGAASLPASVERAFTNPVSPSSSAHPQSMGQNANSAFSPSGREIQLLPLAPELQDVTARWLRAYNVISDNRLRTLGYMSPEGFFLFRVLFIGMARDNPNAAAMHVPEVNRFLEISKEDVMLSLVGSPKRSEVGLKIDGDWTSESQDLEGLNSEGQRYDKKVSFDDELEANRPAGTQPLAVQHPAGRSKDLQSKTLSLEKLEAQRQLMDEWEAAERAASEFQAGKQDTNVTAWQQPRAADYSTMPTPERIAPEDLYPTLESGHQVRQHTQESGIAASMQLTKIANATAVVKSLEAQNPGFSVSMLKRRMMVLALLIAFDGYLRGGSAVLLRSTELLAPI